MVEKKGYISDIKTQVDVNVNRCYQCGKCSAGCAIAEDMDYPPSMVMRMLQTNDDKNFEALLQSQTIWLCVSCQNCLTRCPMQIDIPNLMDYMREKSLAQKKVNRGARNILSFHRAFLDSIRLTGRLYEIGLVANYKLRSKKFFQDLTVAPGMFVKGKLPLLPETVKGKKQIAEIFAKAQECIK